MEAMAKKERIGREPMNGPFQLRKNSGWCGERFGSGRLTEAGKGIMAFAAVRQRRSARRENGPIRVGFTDLSMA